MSLLTMMMLFLLESSSKGFALRLGRAWALRFEFEGLIQVEKQEKRSGTQTRFALYSWCFVLELVLMPVREWRVESKRKKSNETKRNNIKGRRWAVGWALEAKGFEK